MLQPNADWVATISGEADEILRASQDMLAVSVRANAKSLDDSRFYNRDAGP